MKCAKAMNYPSLTIAARSIAPPESLLPCEINFPDPLFAPPEGLVAQGGNLEPETIVEAYRRGLFPWPHDGVDTLWWSPDPRAVLLEAGLHISRRFARMLRQHRFYITVDNAFERVISSCADREDGTWITPAIINAYMALHNLGWAHSIEVWSLENDLIGGLYGLRVGALFGAESMFHFRSDASKVALVALTQYAQNSGIKLIDVQVQNAHLRSMGICEISRESYCKLAYQLTGEASN